MELLSVKLKVPEECKPHWAPPEIWCYFFFFSFVYRGRHNVYFVRRLSAGGHRKSNLQRLKHYREAVSNNNKFRDKASSEHRVPGLPCVAGTRGCAVPGITSRCNDVQKQYINTQTKAASILCFFFLFENGDSFLRTTYTQQPFRLLIGHTVFRCVLLQTLATERDHNHLLRSVVFKTCFQFPDPFSGLKTLKRFWISVFVLYTSISIVLKIKN